MAHPLDTMVGPRRPLGIGVTPNEFRASLLGKPDDVTLSEYSANPRNSVGAWYEHAIDESLGPICQRLGLTRLSKTQRRLTDSKVYLSDKVVDVVVRKEASAAQDRKLLGLELKFLGSQGSLVAPKCLVDAIDFTNRPYHCIYVIDGEGWLEGGKTSYVDFLARWWEFTSSAHLERSLRAYFG